MSHLDEQGEIQAKPGREMVGVFLRSYSALTGLIILIAVSIMGFIGPIFYTVDPFDMVWGDKPIFLPFSDDELAAFGGLAQIEIHDELIGTAESTALFSDDDGLPFSGAQLDHF